MTATILNHRDEGPYYRDTRDTYVAAKLEDFISAIRQRFEMQDDAILVKDAQGEVSGLWLREPDVDCDDEGFFEVAGPYVGAEYVLYRPTYKGFWNYVAYHFGDQHVPQQHGFVTQKHSQVASTCNY